MVIVFVCILLMGNLSANTWYDRKAEGWHWYEDRPVSKDPSQKEHSLEDQPTSSKEQLKAFQEDLEEALATAILKPTKKNVRHYMKMQQIAVQQAEKFQAAWKKVLLMNPDLDPTLQGRPISRVGIRTYEQMKKEDLEFFLSEVSKNHALVFFYEGTCPISQAQAVIARKYADKYGFSLISIATDGVVLDNLPDSIIGYDLVHKLNPKHIPALMLLDPEKERAYPAAYGIASMDIISENLRSQFNRK